MICKHKCPYCGIEFEHLCDLPPKQPLDLIIIFNTEIDYIPPCSIEDYFLPCSECRLKKEMLI